MSAPMTLEPEDREISICLLDQIRRSGAESAVDMCRSSSISSDEVNARTRRSLKRLSRDLYEIACDLGGFGPYAERAIASHTGDGVVSRLTALDDAVRTLLSQLRSIRAEYVSAQLKSLGVNEQSGGLKLHIGCGSHHFKSWINIDHYPAPLSMTALWDLPFGDGTVTRVFVSRVPESLFFPIEIRRFLFEVRRVLTYGGILQIAQVDRRFRSSSVPTTRESVYRNWAYSLEHRTRLDYLLDRTGVDADRTAARTNGLACNMDVLMHMLVEERFTDIQGTESPEFECEEANSVYGPRIDGSHCSRPSSCIEAHKPQH
jgi:hypothetical protein